MFKKNKQLINQLSSCIVLVRLSQTKKIIIKCRPVRNNYYRLTSVGYLNIDGETCGVDRRLLRADWGGGGCVSELLLHSPCSMSSLFLVFVLQPRNMISSRWHPSPISPYFSCPSPEPGSKGDTIIASVYLASPALTVWFQLCWKKHFLSITTSLMFFPSILVPSSLRPLSRKWVQQPSRAIICASYPSQ